MNGLKKLEEISNEEYLEELKKALGDKYSKSQEDSYLEMKDTYAAKPAGVAIRQIAEQYRYAWETTAVFINAKDAQIAEQYRYAWETTAVFINAKDAPAGRRGGEGIVAYFIGDDGTPIMGYMYGISENPFEQFHKYSLSGREIPNRGSHRIITYNDEGEVDADKVVELLKKASQNIDDLWLPDNITAGGVPKIVVGKFVPFVAAEPEWPSAEEREPGQQVRPKGDQPMIQHVGGRLQAVFNGTMVGVGTGRVRYHVRASKTGKHPLEFFITEDDLKELQEEQDKGSDISIKLAQLVGNQGAVCIGSLYRVERVSQPDGTETVYRDIDLVYAIPDEERPQPRQWKTT